jgi:uncharacterized protein (DUF924 family)
MSMTLPGIDDVLAFWFGAPGTPAHGQLRNEWFNGGAAFDEEIAQRFGSLVSQAVAGGLREWDLAGPRGVLARIIVLDQFTRNTGRGTPAAFAGDTLALDAARTLVASGADRTLGPAERAFAYMPFMHAEDAEAQERCVQLFAELAAQEPAFNGSLDYAHRHRGIIARFGRFPHRNEILGRASTADEAAFLQLPGSRF